MKLSRSSSTPLLVAGCAVLLAIFLLMPLVNAMSYRWTIADLGHKLPRLVKSDAARFTAYILLAGMALSPVWLALRTCFFSRVYKADFLLPATFALLLAISLMVTSRPVSPGLGLWLYLVAAIAAFSLQSNRQ